MNTKLLFFGRLAEQIGREREVELPDAGCTIADLRVRLDIEQLAPGGGALASVDQRIVTDDARVMPGQEIAFFSPLSGAEMAVSARLVEQPIAADAELAGFMVDAEGAGAVVTFCGIARGASKTGEAVSALHLDHYPGMTEASLAAIAQDGAARFEVGDILVVHRCGTIQPGEVIVFVAAASPHRRAAFLAADYLMDRLKTEAVFWKKEEGVDAARWIEPTDEDRADLARWR